MAEVLGRGIQIKKGREGLQVPEFSPRLEVATKWDIYYFMRLLFKINGFEVETDSRMPKSEFAHEHVLAADEQRPLTVLRASNKPKSPEEMFRQRERANKMMQRDGQYTIVHGAEEYEILTPPDGSGPFHRYLCVRRTLTSGGGNALFRRSDDSPAVVWQGAPLEESQFWDDESRWLDSMEEHHMRNERRAVKFGAAITGIMQPATELLS